MSCSDFYTRVNTPIFAPILDILKMQNTKKCLEVPLGSTSTGSLFLFVDDCRNNEQKFCAFVFDAERDCLNKTRMRLQFLNIMDDFPDEDDSCQNIVLRDNTVHAVIFRNMMSLDDLILYALGYIKKLF